VPFSVFAWRFQSLNTSPFQKGRHWRREEEEMRRKGIYCLPFSSTKHNCFSPFLPVDSTSGEIKTQMPHP